MYSARDIFTMSLLLADFDRAALRVEGDERIAEQPLDVAAARHIRGREVAQHGWVDQGDRVAERKGDVQFVCREEDALAVVVCQLSQQRAEFVTVRQVEERGRLVEQDDRGVIWPVLGTMALGMLLIFQRLTIVLKHHGIRRFKIE